MTARRDRRAGRAAAIWHVLVGPPLRARDVSREQITPVEGLSALSLDALTSVAATPVVVNPDGDVLPCPVALDYLLMAVAGGRPGPPAPAAGSGAVPRRARRAGTEVRTT